jgi:hypothetical protein
MTLLLSLSPLELDDEIPPLHVPELTEALMKRLDQVGFESRRRVPQIPNGHGSSRRLRVGCERHPQEAKGEGGEEEGDDRLSERSPLKTRAAPPIIFMISETAV